MSNMTFPRHWTIRAIVIAVLATGTLAFFRTGVAHAQASSVKVAVASTEKIFDQLQEKKDFYDKMTKDFKDLQGEQQARAGKLKDMQTQRDLFKPDTPQYIDADNKLLQASIELEDWSKLQSAMLDRKRKREIISLYDKITAAIGKVAKDKGIDVVMADVQPKMPDAQQLDQITENQLLQVLALRDVLYHADTVDIDSAVIAQMDLDYKAGK